MVIAVYHFPSCIETVGGRELCDSTVTSDCGDCQYRVAECYLASENVCIFIVCSLDFNQYYDRTEYFCGAQG